MEDYILINNTLVIKDGVTCIDKNKIKDLDFKKVILPGSLHVIEANIFARKSLEEVILCEGIEEIKDYAFAYNFIEKISFPTTLKSIGSYAFFRNKLLDISLNEGLYKIEEKAFYDNLIKEVLIPESLEFIGSFVFPSDTKVIIDEKKYECFIINQFNKYGFLQVYRKLIKMIPDIDFNKVNINIIIMLIEDNNFDIIKTYWYNRKIFDQLYNLLFSYKKIVDIQYLFKFAYILGFFSVDKNKQNMIMDFLKMFYLEDRNDYIIYFFDSLDKLIYYPKFAELFINYYDNDYFKSIAKDYYLNYNDVNKVISVMKKDKIRLKCIERTKLKEKKLDILEIQNIIKFMRDNLNIININDLIWYFNNKFEVREDCFELKKIVSLLSGHIECDEFNRIQDLYIESKEKSKLPQVFSFIKNDINEYGYEWMRGDDVRQFVIGYITNCCSHIAGAGEQIMVESMINPCVKIMIIYYFGKIIGKTTAYYNQEKEYLLFNNIEISNSFMNSMIIGEKERLNVLETIIVGIKDQIKEMKKNGYNVRSVRIGMNNNDLASELEKMFVITRDNLFENYNYGDYLGDASKEQAIVKLRKDLKNELY